VEYDSVLESSRYFNKQTKGEEIMENFIIFKNAGIKINRDTFEVLPSSDEYADENQDGPIYLSDIPVWDIQDITDFLSEKENELFWKLIRKSTGRK
jgi:hypothetical protein